jgi:hypothetical protein
MPCAIGSCYACPPNPPGPYMEVCVTNGAAPNSFCREIVCDGPEDCPAGELCLDGEWPRCATTIGFEEHIVCHSDCNCPSTLPHCRGSNCAL